LSSRKASLCSKEKASVPGETRGRGNKAERGKIKGLGG